MSRALPALRIMVSCHPCDELLSIEYFSTADLRMRQVLEHRLNLSKLAFEGIHRACGADKAHPASPPAEERKSIRSVYGYEQEGKP